MHAGQLYQMLHDCAATGCRAGDLLRIVTHPVLSVTRLRDGVALEPNIGKLAAAIAAGFVIPVDGPPPVPPAGLPASP